MATTAVNLPSSLEGAYSAQICDIFSWKTKNHIGTRGGASNDYNYNLEYDAIGKFSYGWPDNLRRLIPKQCGLKGEYNIGLLSNKHVLIRATLLEDYLNMLSKSSFYIMITFEETTSKVVWIYFLILPPNFLGRETVLEAMGKSLHVDMATRNQIRPSYARVKVEVDSLGKFHKSINIGLKNRNGEILKNESG
ncbi:hypothetical protein H5410_035817 [Solanum commersonii]|uniref:DUF4283 domain-containing protein n=1 Tax=Solanum commersonii TaxID=4109 RepID=A0A9J5Y2D2_SOLCO|nr:hypothetical protein H5410_035817 [Solanum commersonii]